MAVTRDVEGCFVSDSFFRLVALPEINEVVGSTCVAQKIDTRQVEEKFVEKSKMIYCAVGKVRTLPTI